MKNDTSDSSSQPSRWKQWLMKRLDLMPGSREELLEQLRQANYKNILSYDAVEMIEGVIEFSALQVQDVMIPRAQVEFIQHDDDFLSVLKQVIETEHSRYPVIDEGRDELVGILLAKDLLRYVGNDSAFAMSDILRPPLIVPETQPLNRLLAEFRNTRSHLAMVIDEYAAIVGLVTFEDVLEQIVGDIDDEHDEEEDENAYISEPEPGRFIVEGVTPLEEFNQALAVAFDEDEADTVAGIVISHLGKIPREGDEVRIKGLNFRVLNSDNRRILSLEVVKSGVHTSGNPVSNQQAAA